MSVTEAESYLENKFDQEYAEFIRIFSQNPHFYEQLGELNIFPNNTYQETINFYKSNYDKDFPEIASFDVKIENIHESLEENSSPAMYFLFQLMQMLLKSFMLMIRCLQMIPLMLSLL